MPNARQRRATEQRRLRRQLQRRRQQTLRRRRLNLTLSVAGTIVVIAIVVGFIIATNGDGSPSATNSPVRPGTPTSATPTSPTSSASTPTPSTARSSTASSSSVSSSTASSPVPATTSRAARAGTASCTYRLTGTPARKVDRPAAKEPATGTVRVAVPTSQGRLTFALNRANAPCAVGSFVSLARQGYFANSPCHRLVTQGIFVVQCGDPTGTGRGGPGYAFADELTGNEQYTRGVLAMANGGPDTNGSQFFIVYRKSALGPQYTVLGRVTAGLGVIDKVARAGTQDGSSDGRPKLPLTIRRVTVLR